MIALMLLSGEPWPHPETDGLDGLDLPGDFQSPIGFTAYVTAVRSLPLSVVMTYAYVAIAVLLGWLVLGERITISTILGTALILTGSSGFFGSGWVRAVDDLRKRGR